ncbi:MAG: hypothetical protein LBB98_07920 [Treponema sp.]|nr:hypothetical protein [Treponema sp.]
MYPDLLVLPLLAPILIAMVAVYGATHLYFDQAATGPKPIGGLDRRFSVLGSGYIGFDGVYSIPYIVMPQSLRYSPTSCSTRPPMGRTSTP